MLMMMYRFRLLSGRLWKMAKGRMLYKHALWRSIVLMKRHIIIFILHIPIHLQQAGQNIIDVTHFVVLKCPGQDFPIKVDNKIIKSASYLDQSPWRDPPDNYYQRITYHIINWRYATNNQHRIHTYRSPVLDPPSTEQVQSSLKMLHYIGDPYPRQYYQCVS